MPGGTDTDRQQTDRHTQTDVGHWSVVAVAATAKDYRSQSEYGSLRPWVEWVGHAGPPGRVSQPVIALLSLGSCREFNYLPACLPCLPA